MKFVYIYAYNVWKEARVPSATRSWSLAGGEGRSSSETRVRLVRSRSVVRGPRGKPSAAERGRTLARWGKPPSPLPLPLLRRVVGVDALLSPALTQFLRRRRWGCLVARSRSLRHRVATAVLFAAFPRLSSLYRRIDRRRSLRLVAIFRHGDS